MYYAATNLWRYLSVYADYLLPQSDTTASNTTNQPGQAAGDAGDDLDDAAALALLDDEKDVGIF